MLNVSSAVVVPVSIGSVRAVTLRPILWSLSTPVAAVTPAAALHVMPGIDSVVVQGFQHALAQSGIEVS
jgi:hypothetical protein